MATELGLRRVILFTPNLAAMGAFYGDVIGLALIGSEKGWREYKAGGCNIALHTGRSTVGQRPPKLVLYARDVAATRDELIARGAKMGKIISTEHFDMCDGKDPDGNVFQISGRG